MKKGFTLIETIVAVGVFGVAVIAVIGFYASSAKIVDLARQTTIATNLAQAIVEKNLSEPYDNLILGQSEKQAYSTDPGSAFNNFSYQTNTTLVDQNLSPSNDDLGLKKINCSVFWPTTFGERKVEVVSVIVKK